MPEIRAGSICLLRFAELLGVVVARWHDEEGDDVRVVPLSEGEPYWLQNATDRDVIVRAGSPSMVAHAWLARTMPASLLGTSRATLPDEVLRVIRSAEMIGIDPEAERAYPEWRGRPLKGDGDDRVARMRQLLSVWDDAENFALWFGKGPWSKVARGGLTAVSMRRKLKDVTTSTSHTLEHVAYDAAPELGEDESSAVAA